MKTTVKAHAKINLYLAVTGRRENGYHDIESVMQSVSLSDTVSVEITHSPNIIDISLSCSDKTLPTDEKNIAFKAALRLCEKVNLTNVKIHIDIEKNIPVAAGLAGGSADAAGTLTALNSLLPNFGIAPLSEDSLCELAATLGADIPFVIRGGTMTARGIGEILEPCAPLSDDVYILIVRPKESVSTAAAYAKIDEKRLFSTSAEHSLDATVKALKNGDLFALSRSAYNVFEKAIPETSEVFMLKKLLSDMGAELSMMSGSGPSVFGIFSSLTNAEKAGSALKNIGYDSELCAPEK